jgi:pimeloyl-ACP methyl ester carboxylesterase
MKISIRCARHLRSRSLAVFCDLARPSGAAALLAEILALRPIAPKTIVFGQSLGTAVATNLAAHAPVGALVLEAPFPSATAVARRTFWFLPGVGLMVAGQLNTKERLRHVNVPVLVVHCSQDPVIPPDLAEQVYESARPPKSILRVDGYCHEEAAIIAPVTYRAALQIFLASLNQR